MSFAPDPSPYRDLVAGTITNSEFLAACEEEVSWQGPTRSTYEDWFAGAYAWASSHSELDLMDFQIKQFAKNTAWVFEGSDISADSFDRAWDHHLSGLSGGPHHVPLEGYDLDFWRRSALLRSLSEMEEAAISRGIESPELEKVMALWSSWSEDAIDTHSSTVQEFLDDWFSGALIVSPHHIPLDPKNEEERTAERARVLGMKCYSDLAGASKFWKVEDLVKHERPSFPLERSTSRFSR